MSSKGDSTSGKSGKRLASSRTLPVLAARLPRVKVETTKTEVVLAGLFVVIALAVLVLVPVGRPFDPVVAAVALLVFSASLMVQVPASSGFSTITQPSFVLIVFVVPLNLVPALVGVVTVVTLYAQIRRAGRSSPSHWSRWVNNAWWAVAPVLVLAVGAPGPANWSHWPVYVLAFGAQFLTDALVDMLARPARGDQSLSGFIAEGFEGARVDALLTPAGVSAAVSTTAAPASGIGVVAGLTGLLFLMACERSERVEHQERAEHDPLTGLANRALFDEAVRTTTGRRARSSASAAVLLIDVDDFKGVNDRHGHHCGDQVLQAFADRLRDRLRSSDTAARIGGDEFAVLLAEPTSQTQADAIAASLRKALKQPIDIPHVGVLEVSASVGAALLSGKDTGASALEAADRAMYAEKRHRRSSNAR